MAIAGGNITLDSTEGIDKISQTEKVTSPYFSDGTTELLAASIVTSSLSDTNETYFFGISNSSTPTVEEFNVAFGSTRGYGSKVEANTKAETEAIYKQYSNLLLAPTEVTGGFVISSPGSAGALGSGKDTEIFVLSARRSNMKDRINKGSWKVSLSGSSQTGVAASTVAGTDGLLHLKDDSSTTEATATPVGDRYNIVSCSSAGTIAAAATTRNFGFFYPDMGIMVFSQQELSASIPGSGSHALHRTVAFNSTDHKGFTVSTDTDNNEKTAMRFINCLTSVGNTTGTGAKLTFRDEEDQVSAQYFCRVRSGQMNFSNNPTYVSGSLNELRQKTMKGNPSTFISSVQLYNSTGDIVAVGNLSTPLKKNFSSEATIKVKLTY